MALITNFIEERFPEDISMGSSGGPNFNTNIVSVNSGFEQRNINWSESRASYNVRHGVKLLDQMRNLVAFFYMVRGKAIGFRYKDWLDFSAVGESIAQGDSVQLSFQLVKNYTFGIGAVSYVRQIYKPVAGTASVYVDGILDNTAIVDSTTGLINFVVAPGLGAIITADFEFDVPVRFDTDNFNSSFDSATIQSWDAISLIELKQ